MPNLIVVQVCSGNFWRSPSCGNSLMLVASIVKSLGYEVYRIEVYRIYSSSFIAVTPFKRKNKPLPTISNADTPMTISIVSMFVQFGCLSR